MNDLLDYEFDEPEKTDGGWCKPPLRIFKGSVEQAIAWVKKFVYIGVICPCCEGQMKRYKRTLIAGYAAWMCNLVRLYKDDADYHHVKEIGKVSPGTHDFAKLEKWEFIVQKRNEDTTRRCSGMWAPTPLGIDWVSGTLRAPKHAIIQNNILLRFEGALVNIYDSLGEEFDYEELMRPVP